MKENMEVEDELNELKRVPSHHDLPLLEQYPLVKCTYRLSLDIRFVNFMKKHAEYHNHVCQYIIKQNIRVSHDRSILDRISIFKNCIKLYIKNDLGIEKDEENELILYIMLDRALNTRIAIMQEYHNLCTDYNRMFESSSNHIIFKKIVLRFGWPIKNNLRDSLRFG
jgi:hypothetical protein